MTRVEDYDVSKLAEVIEGELVPTVYGYQMCRRATIEPVPQVDGTLVWKMMLYGGDGSILGAFFGNTPAAAIKWMFPLTKPVPEPDEEPWVNVNDSLPASGVPCWTRDRANRIRLARLYRSSPDGSRPTTPWWCYEMGERMPAVVSGVTHWMLDREPEGPVEL